MASVSTKRAKFITAFLETDNATEAAKLAGYSTPAKAGSRLLTHPEVREALAKEAAKHLKRRDISLDGLTSMALDVHDAEDARAGDRLKAIETVARLHKMFDVEVSHKHEHVFVGVSFDEMKTIDHE